MAPDKNNCAFVLLTYQAYSSIVVVRCGRPGAFGRPGPSGLGREAYGLGGTKAHFPRLGGEHIAENSRLGAGLANTKVKASPIRTEAGRGFRGHAKDRNNGKVQKSQLLSVSYANDGEQERI